MNWIAILFALELGFTPQGFLETYTSDMSEYYETRGAGYIELSIEIDLFKYAFIGGNIKTYMKQYKGVEGFWPINASYMFTTGIRADIVEVGFRHFCTHPVVPWINNWEISPRWEGAYEEIYIKFEIGKK